VIDLRPIGELRLSEPRRHLPAASGLVHCGGHLYVVSDEELAVAAFEWGDPATGRLVALDDERLPADPAARKAAKPDLEALCELPPAAGWPRGALLALGSGATARRERAWLCPREDGCRLGAPAEVSLAPLYAALRGRLEDLNVEGAAVAGDRLWLAQRGNGAHGANALVELALERAVETLASERALPDDVLSVTTYELGSTNDVALGFSDLTPLPDGRLAFCAVAEAGESTYLDGECVGAAFGTLVPGAAGAPALRPLSEPHKVEGVAVTALSGGQASLLFVADPDDPALPSPLFAASAELPG
jgi:hypothetical protein